MPPVRMANSAGVEAPSASVVSRRHANPLEHEREASSTFSNPPLGKMSMRTTTLRKSKATIRQFLPNAIPLPGSRWKTGSTGGIDAQARRCPCLRPKIRRPTAEPAGDKNDVIVAPIRLCS